MKKNVFLLSLIIGFFAVCVSINASAQNKPWNAPEAAKGKKNPLPNDAKTIATAKSLWSTHCKSCHGTKGLGDGSKAAQLDTEPGDFSKSATQSQSDGSLFFKTSEGRDDMPSFKKKIPDEEDRWALVHYIRSFKK